MTDKENNYAKKHKVVETEFINNIIIRGAFCNLLFF